MAAIDTVFLHMSNLAYERTSKSQLAQSLSDQPALQAALSSPLDASRDVHDPTRPILYREFVEAIVRIANMRYSETESLPSVAVRTEYLLHNQIQDKPLRELDVDDVQNFAKVFDNHDSDLRALFQKFANADRSFLMLDARHDSTMTMMEFLRCLRHLQVLGAKISMRDAISVSLQRNFGCNPLADKNDDIDMADMLDIEMIYWEFLNCLGAVFRHLQQRQKSQAAAESEPTDGAADDDDACGNAVDGGSECADEGHDGPAHASSAAADDATKGSDVQPTQGAQDDAQDEQSGQESFGDWIARLMSLWRASDE